MIGSIGEFGYQNKRATIIITIESPLFGLKSPSFLKRSNWAGKQDFKEGGSRPFKFAGTEN